MRSRRRSPIARSAALSAHTSTNRRPRGSRRSRANATTRRSCSRTTTQPPWTCADTRTTPTEDLESKARHALAEAGRQAQALNAHATAARHFRAALDLSREDDAEWPQLLLEEANALSRAARPDTAILEGALTAQVKAEDWDGAAQMSYLLGLQAAEYAGDRERADEYFEQSTRYASRIPYTPVVSLVAAYRAYFLLVAGRASEVIRVTDATMRRADDAGDSAGRAVLMMWHGDARLTGGDPEGINEMRDAARILSDHGHRMATSASGTISPKHCLRSVTFGPSAKHAGRPSSGLSDSPIQDTSR